MNKRKEKVALTIPLDKRRGEKQSGNYIYGYVNHSEIKYGNRKKRSRLTFYMKALDETLVGSWNISEIKPNDHFVIHPSFEENTPAEIKETIERISILFV